MAENFRTPVRKIKNPSQTRVCASPDEAWPWRMRPVICGEGLNRCQNSKQVGEIVLTAIHPLFFKPYFYYSLHGQASSGHAKDSKILVFQKRKVKSETVIIKTATWQRPIWILIPSGSSSCITSLTTWVTGQPLLLPHVPPILERHLCISTFLQITVCMYI